MVNRLLGFGIVFVALLFFGCISPDNNNTANNSGNDTINHTSNYDGLTIKQSTVGRFGNLSIGVVSVQSDSATISVWDGSEEQTFSLNLGENVVFKGYSITNIETYVSPIVAVMPGSSEDFVTLNISQVS